MSRRPRSSKPKSLALAAGAVALTLVAAELVLRLLLFGGLAIGEPLRDPGLYADYFSEDVYWKLYYRFGGSHGPPAHPHPLLGWVGDFDRRSYRHDDAERLAGRRPVLLYGDSYADCVEGVECFEEILAADPAFAEDRCLLNYGVGGYGFDQIYLLLRRSVDLYDDPFVVVSLLTFDLDRAILGVRSGQKPRFRPAGEGVELEARPIYERAADFYAENPPGAPSYLWRKLLYSDLLPDRWSERLRGEPAYRQRKIELGRRLVGAAVDELRSRGLDFAFVVFHTEFPGVSELLGGVDDWRDRLLREELEERGVTYVWSKELIAADAAAHGRTAEDYIDPEHRHPTALYNRLVAAEIERLSR